MPIWRRRPLSFCIGLGLPALFTHPSRPSFVNQALPTTYSELWGDWEGHFTWGYGKPPAPPPNRRLAVQNALGLLPTGLAIAGWLMLLARTLRPSNLGRDPAPLAIALLPAAALLGYLYFTVAYPILTGNELKASYMLTDTPAWALAFGSALERVPQRRRITLALASFLLIGLIVDLPFLLYRV